MAYQLDFRLLPDLSSGSIIRRLDLDLVQPMSVLPQTRARAEAAIHFSHVMGFKDHTLPVRESYLRASLAEYVSMEDSLPRDLKALGRPVQVIRSSSSPNPLLHIIRELRNLEIHLRSSQMSVSKTAAKYEDTEGSGTWRDIELSAWWIDPITEPEFAELRNARNYDPSDITRMLDWFNDAQKVWGVDELLRLAVNSFSREIVLTLGIVARSR